MRPQKRQRGGKRCSRTSNPIVSSTQTLKWAHSCTSRHQMLMPYPCLILNILCRWAPECPMKRQVEIIIKLNLNRMYLVHITTRRILTLRKIRLKVLTPLCSGRPLVELGKPIQWTTSKLAATSSTSTTNLRTTRVDLSPTSSSTTKTSRLPRLTKLTIMITKWRVLCQRLSSIREKTRSTTRVCMRSKTSPTFQGLKRNALVIPSQTSRQTHSVRSLGRKSTECGMKVCSKSMKCGSSMK